MVRTKEHQPLIDPETGEPDPMVWIAVRSKPAQERRAKQHLVEQMFEVYLPMMRYVGRGGVTLAKPFLPSYLFARVAVDVERWQTVYGTLGVHGVMGRPECPIGIKDVVIDRIKAQETDGYVQFAESQKGPKLELGERYRDVHTGLEGLFTERVDDRRVILLSRLLGEAPMTVDIRRLKKV